MDRLGLRCDCVSASGEFDGAVPQPDESLFRHAAVE